MLSLSTPSKNIIAITISLIAFLTLCIFLLPSSFIFWFTIWVRITFFVLFLAFYLALKYNLYTVTWFWVHVEGDSYV